MGTLHLRSDRPLDPGLAEDRYAALTVDGDIWPFLGRLRGGGVANGVSAYPLVTVWPTERLGVDPDGTPVLENTDPLRTGRAAVHIRETIRRSKDHGRQRIREYKIEFPWQDKLPAEVIVQIEDAHYTIKAFRMSVIDTTGVRAVLGAERAV